MPAGRLATVLQRNTNLPGAHRTSGRRDRSSIRRSRHLRQPRWRRRSGARDGTWILSWRERESALPPRSVVASRNIFGPIPVDPCFDHPFLLWWPGANQARLHEEGACLDATATEKVGLFEIAQNELVIAWGKPSTVRSSARNSACLPPAGRRGADRCRIRRPGGPAGARTSDRYLHGPASATATNSDE